MPRTKLIIEANTRKLLLAGDTISNRQVQDEYHFKKSERTRDVKVCASHTGSYCKRMKLSCDKTRRVQLPIYSISTLQLTGDGNELFVNSAAVRRYSHPKSHKIAFIINGGNNTLSVDIDQDFDSSGLLPVQQLNILTKPTCGSTRGSHRIVLCGTIATLSITLNDTRRVCLDASHLIVTQKATVKCCTEDLLQELKKPRLLSFASWNYQVEQKQQPTLPAVISQQLQRSISQKTKTLLPAYSKHSSVIEWSPGLCLAACNVCMTNVPNAVCVPCGHMLCVQCAYSLCNRLKQDQQLVCPCGGCEQSVGRVQHVILNTETGGSSCSSSSSSSRKRTLDAITIED